MAFHDDGYRIGEDFGVRYRSRRSASTRIKVSVSNIVKVKIRPARALLLLTAETFLRLFGCVLTRQWRIIARARFVFREGRADLRSEVAMYI